MPEPIVETCRNPAKTRTDAVRGLTVPCYHCLAYRPETQTGCHFLEIRPAADRVSPKRSSSSKQEKLW
jgi:hypothetical protein